MLPDLASILKHCNSITKPKVFNFAGKKDLSIYYLSKWLSSQDSSFGSMLDWYHRVVGSNPFKGEDYSDSNLNYNLWNRLDKASGILF